MSNREYRPPVDRPVLTRPAPAESPLPPLDLSKAGKSDSPIADDDAKSMLARAARAIDCFITKAHAVLESVTPERLRMAMVELENKPEPDVVQDPDQRKRPRGAPDPLVKMLKMLITGSNLLRRILQATNPVIFGVLNPLERDLMATLKQGEGFVRGLQEAGKLRGIAPA